MTPDQFRSARATLGELHGLGRPYEMSEFGRLLRLGGANPDDSIRNYERGKTRISGPLALAIEAMLDGWRPRAAIPKAQKAPPAEADGV